MPNSPKIKAIIFDCFGVIYPEGSDKLYDRYKKLFGSDKSFLDEMNKQIDLNEISSNTYYKRLGDRIGIPAEKIKAEKQQFLILRLDVMDLIKKLKKEYKIALISNAGEGELFALERDGIIDLFDVITDSHLIRIIKPDPRIYESCAKDLGMAPSECIFIDDKSTNIVGAKKVGMKTIHYKNVSQLKTNLGGY